MQREIESYKSTGQESLSDLELLKQKLKGAKEVDARLQILLQFPRVEAFLNQYTDFYRFVSNFKDEAQYLLLSLVAVGQGSLIKNMFQQEKSERRLEFFNLLQEVDSFYTPIGGIIGYHLMILKLLSGHDFHKNCHYLHPAGVNLSQDSKVVREYTISGISALKDLAEIYPIGGAGERLGLTDEKGRPLPVACLPFCGRTLLEGLVRDLQARESLYYKLFHEQLFTPIVMMTSHEKENDSQIEKICEDASWFGRQRDLFFRFAQPEAPVLTKEGMWSFKSPLQLSTKPGGHGVLWTLCKQTGAFEWLKRKGRHKVLIRQINNPIAGTDSGLLGFIGVGYRNNKAFGFASCPRKVGTAEGVVILVQKQDGQPPSYCISNIEYAEFSKKGIEDRPISPDSPYSAFPANTNILYADISSLEMAEKKLPFPGMLLNMKSDVPYMDAEGNFAHMKGGRLECMMQNIAEGIDDAIDGQITEEQIHQLKTYATFYDRVKTISVTKKSYIVGEKIIETPEGCFYDYQKNMHLLFSEYCGIEMPFFSSESDYLNEGPAAFIQIHPAIGPLWEVIAQKIRKGTIVKGSELNLEIADVDIENLTLDGSCLIEADQIMGHQEDGLLSYSEFTGKCELRNISIINQGIKRSSQNHYWKNEISRNECFSIHLQGNAEFYAENVTFRGNHRIEVPAGHRMTAREINGTIRYDLDPIDRASWNWKYAIDDSKHIQLTRISYKPYGK